MSDLRRDVDVGGSATFEALYRRELARVVALAYVLSGSRPAAEDLAQEAFLAAHRRWDEIGGYDDPAAIIFPPTDAQTVFATGATRDGTIWLLYRGGPSRACASR